MTKGKSSKTLFILLAILSIIGALMITSAEMGNAAGSSEYLTKAIIKEVIITCISFIAYFVVSKMYVLNYPLTFYKYAYFIVVFFLLLPLGFGAVGGANAWIRIGTITIQPSEFAKLFLIVFGAKMIGIDRGEKNIKFIRQYWLSSLILVGIVAVLESDLGSAIVMAGITYGISMIPCFKGMAKIHNWLIKILLIMIAVVVIAMSPLTNEFLMEHVNNYRVARFLAAANPFYDQYNTGYHVVMSLVTFATGGLTGLGYGNSIHKYMNFPNPSNDFILPIIVEELGIIGFVVIMFFYLGIMFIIMRYSLKTKEERPKMVLLGVFMYFALHFVFNVGGVSGLIPLTGVPLLLLSSGGSSTLAAFIAIALCQEIISREEIE